MALVSTNEEWQRSRWWRIAVGCFCLLFVVASFALRKTHGWETLTLLPIVAVGLLIMTGRGWHFIFPLLMVNLGTEWLVKACNDIERIPHIVAALLALLGAPIVLWISTRRGADGHSGPPTEN